MSFISARMANALGASGRIAEELDKGTTTRPSSTALLSVDSLDREQTLADQSSANFVINKKNSLFNGYFNRIAMAEVILDWCIPNISLYTQNRTINVTVGGVTAGVAVSNGNYTVARLLDSIVIALNGAFGAGFFRLEDEFGAVYVAGTSQGPVFLASTGGGNFTVNPTTLAGQLNLRTGVAGNAFPVTCPKLLPYYYIDFVSPQLTYNQDLKDNTTSEVARDSLYRWVFAQDNVAIPSDKYGYPILQGYTPFILRRALSYPKQILWDPTQPLGQLTFQVFTSNGDLLDPTALEGECEFQMSLLFSEN